MRKSKLKLPLFLVVAGLLLLLLFIYGPLFVEPKTDCPEKAKSEPTSDTAFINKLNLKAFSFRKIQPDSAFKLSHYALKKSLSLNYKKGAGDACLTLGYTHLLNYSKNDSATIYLQRAQDIYKKINDKSGLGMAYFGMAYAYSFKGNLRESEKSLMNCLAFFKQAKNKKGEYDAYNSLAYIYLQFKDFDKSFGYIQNAMNTASQLGDTAKIADALNSLGNIYHTQNLFQQAMDTYFKALHYWDSKNDSAGMSIAYGNIGLMYYKLNDYIKSFEYYKKKLPLSIKTKNYWEQSKTYVNMGLNYLSLENYDSALVCYKKGLNLNMMMNYPQYIADSYFFIANTYFKKNSNDSAIFYIDKCIDKGEKIDNKANLAGCYILLGKINLANQKNESALSNALKGYNLAKELKISNLISEASELLSTIYTKINKYDLAYKHLSEFKLMEDSLDKEKNLKEITRLEIQYEFDKKSRKIEYEQAQERLAHKSKLKQQWLYFSGSIITLVFIALSTVLITRQKNLRIKLESINLEQKLLRTQMDPHFIFNSLCAVQDYILDNKPNEANLFLSRFSALIRSVLESSRQDYVTLEIEIQTLKNYIEIQKNRFEKDFEYSFDIDEDIEIESIAIPPMLAQPFIENSIEHGLLPKKGKGTIAIRYKFEKDLIRLTIEDNGIGRKESGMLKKNNLPGKHSLAIQLTGERFDYLKTFVNKNSGFEIEDTENEKSGTGTKVILLIPFKKVEY